MKKIFFLIAVIAASLFVSAQYPVPLITSADQYYSVVFDEEDEAIVSLSLTIKNSDSDPINTVNLEIPGLGVNILGVLQETTSYENQVCTKWQTGCIEYGEGQTCVQYDYKGNCQRYERPCLKQGQTCAAYTTSYNRQVIYKKISVTPVQLSNSVSVPIDLLSSVQQNGQTNLLIVYKVEGYARKTLGLHKFEFETAKLPYTTNTIRVAINVQNNLYLKGGASQINYLPNIGTFSKAMESAALTDSMSSEISSFSQKISYMNGLVKTATYLDPYESFSVEGKYSSSWTRLYWGRIILIAILVLLIIGFLVYGGRKIVNYASANLEPVAKKHKETSHHFLFPFLAGLFTAIGISLLWVAAILIIEVSQNIMRGGVQDIFAVLLVLFSILISLALVIGVPSYAGNKFGGLIGVFTLVSILGWLFILTIVIFLVFNLFTSIF